MSAETIFGELDPVMTRWTMGGQAASVAPAALRPALGSDASEAELRLLALTGQYLSLCVVPTPATALSEVPDIPQLAIPLVPDSQAVLVRRCLKVLKESGGQRDLIWLLAGRGYAVHPADWMPSRHDEAVPDIYSPWRDWAEGQAGQSASKQDVHEELTEANWSDWWPSARRIALSQIRAHDPARATALLAAKAAGEGADVRLRLIECLIPGLSDTDIPYLESLSTDRAPKIKALAASLLARLGRGSGTSDDASELADFFEVQTKGLLRRTRIVVARPIKTPAQRSRRDTLFAQVDFESFAHALGVTASELVSFWALGNNAEADYAFLGSVEQTGSATIVHNVYSRLMEETTIDLRLLLKLRPRLDDQQRSALARRVLNAKGSTFQSVLSIAGAGAEMDALIETQPGRALLSAAGGDIEIAPELSALALLASQAAARAAFDRLAEAGLNASDPRLDFLRLNAALPHSGAIT